MLWLKYIKPDLKKNNINFKKNINNYKINKPLRAFYYY